MYHFLSYLFITIYSFLQTELVLHCLAKITDLGFHMHALTADGQATNITMARLLGCDLNLESATIKLPFTLLESGERSHLFRPVPCNKTSKEYA